MTDPGTPDDDAGPAPTQVRIAVTLLGLISVLLLATALLIWLAQDRYVADLVAAGDTEDAAAQTALLLLLVFAVTGVTAAVAAFWLTRRRAWARQLGLLTASLLAVISLLQVLQGALSIQTLMVLAASVTATATLLSPLTKEWVRRR